MDHDQELEIAEEFPDSWPSAASNVSVESSPHVNSTHKPFEAFPNHTRSWITFNHVEGKGKVKVSLVSPKHEIAAGDPKQNRHHQFLQFQKSFQEQKERKLSILKEEKQRQEADECTSTPQINNHSRKLTSHVQTSCYQRLFKQKPIQHPIVQPKHLPKILNKSKNLCRSENVADLLYNDAQRRIQKQRITQRQRMLKTDTQPAINDNTDKLVVRKLKGEYLELIGNKKELSQTVTLAILSTLFHVSLDSKRDSQTGETCMAIVDFLFGSSHDPIGVVRLWSFIEITVGCSQTSQVFNKQEQDHIKKQFKGVLYRNRMTRSRKSKQERQPTFRPQILKNSQKLARKKRDRMATQAQELLQRQKVNYNSNGNQDLPIADLYILQRLHNQEENRQKRQIEDDKEFEKCTFKPQLNKCNGSRDSFDIMPSSTKSSRAREQYNKRSHGNTQNTLLTVKTLETFQLQRDDSQVRKRSTSRTSQNRSFREVKNMESTVLRLSAGRKDREYNHQLLKRGYPKDIQNWQQFRKTEKKAVETAHSELKGYNRSPLPKRLNGFIFDIHISQGIMQTIHLCKSEDIIIKVQEITSKYNLDLVKKQKLVQMMRSHLGSYMQRQKQNTCV